MDFLARVQVIDKDVLLDGRRLYGMRGTVVDRPRAVDRKTGLARDRRFVRFEATQTDGEFFTWLKASQLRVLTD